MTDNETKQKGCAFILRNTCGFNLNTEYMYLISGMTEDQIPNVVLLE